MRYSSGDYTPNKIRGEFIITRAKYDNRGKVLEFRCVFRDFGDMRGGDVLSAELVYYYNASAFISGPDDLYVLHYRDRNNVVTASYKVNKRVFFSHLLRILSPTALISEWWLALILIVIANLAWIILYGSLANTSCRRKTLQPIVLATSPFIALVYAVVFYYSRAVNPPQIDNWLWKTEGLAHVLAHSIGVCVLGILFFAIALVITTVINRRKGIE
jgi:hypothetical protein